MAVRNYSSTAVETTLASAATDSETTLAVASATGFPAVPFVLCVDAGAVNQELVLVTGIAGTNLTVTRGYDSTVATAHEIGAVVQHSHAAVDFREANTHVNATAAHGTTGAVVGTTDVQTLTNKTLTAPVIDGTDSVGGEWTEWTPTWTNLTVGDGVVTARYNRIGKTINLSLVVVAGSTSTTPVASTAATFTLPVAPLDAALEFFGTMETSGGSSLHLRAVYASSAATIQMLNADGQYEDYPGLFIPGNSMRFFGTYEIA